MALIWYFSIYFAIETRQGTISSAQQRLSQMASAVGQYTENTFKIAEIFQATTERWLETNAPEDPMTDSQFSSLITFFRESTSNIVDVRIAKSNGDLYYFPNNQEEPRDNVADREYFTSVADNKPGLIHIGIPVVSRVSDEWRLPVSVRMKKTYHDLEIINASVNLAPFIGAFESQRPRPNGSISLWNNDGTLLARAPQSDMFVGRKVEKNSEKTERTFIQPAGYFLTESSLADGPVELISYTNLKDFPLTVVVTEPLSQTLRVWHSQVIWGSAALVLITLVAAIFSASLVHTLRQQENHRFQLTLLATTDSLTGVLNRRRFTEVGTDEFFRCRRYDKPMSLLMLDIDHFKNVNDTWGHLAGDHVLQNFAATINVAIRETDRMGRWGGEEFAVLLPETDLTDAGAVAERIRYAVQESTSMSLDGESPIRVTVSIGVASLSPNDTSFENILSRADNCLYNAKTIGRNCVSSAD